MLAAAVSGVIPALTQKILMQAGLLDEMGYPLVGFLEYRIPASSERSDETAPTLIPSTPPSTTSAAEEIPAIPTSLPTPMVTPYKPVDKPVRMIIDSIKLDAKIVESTPATMRIGSTEYMQWKAPDADVVGWQTTSAELGIMGNSVFFGHHNVYGNVFGNLHNVVQGDLIKIEGHEALFSYQAVNVMIVQERGVDMATRLENARWIMPSEDERITLVTCHPAESNTHRLIIVAVPFGDPIPISRQLPDEQPR